MSSKFANHSALAALAAGFVLSSALILAPATSQAAYAGNAPVTLGQGNWKINVAKSHFGPEGNTMVLEHAGAADEAQGASQTFVVIANGKVYLATSFEAFDKITGNGVKQVDYSRWKDMKLIQVGEGAKALDLCGFRCQAGLPDDRLTVSFKSVNGGMPEMSGVVVFNQR